MKARTCVGIYAKNAYYFERLGIEVFCVEELSYCLKTQAFLLGSEIMSDEMLRFIGVECQLPDLARVLHPMVHQKGSLSGFVTAILEYVGFFDSKELEMVETTIRKGSGLTDFEKQKLQIDGLVEKKKYKEAIEAYDELLEEMESKDFNEKNESFIADLLYNQGVVYAYMLLYEKASDNFQKSYEKKKEASTIQAYFFAKRMMLPEQEYISLAAKHSENYELSLQVEQRIKELNMLWEESPEFMGLENMRRWRTTGDNHRYYEECDQLVNILKDDYRQCV